MIKQGNTEIAIYAATHNQTVSSADSLLVPIQTGAALAKERLCEIRDNTGENISDRNHTFCELTALYWIWKNDAHPITGLSHYRRRFNISEEEVNLYLRTNDLIIPQPYFFRCTLREEYKKNHIGADLDILCSILSEMAPSFAAVLNRVLDENRLIPYNMMIARRTLLSDYCEWLFPILFKLEAALMLEGRTAYQKRVFGFLSERLFTAYIEAQHLKYYICPVSLPETENLLRRIKYSCGIRFNQIYFEWTRLHERN